jgi:hypothetical protein
MHRPHVQGPLVGVGAAVGVEANDPKDAFVFCGFGLGASQTVHFSVAVPGFCSIQRLHVHCDPADAFFLATGGATIAAGFGASHTVHLTVADAGLLSIQRLHVQLVPADTVVDLIPDGNGGVSVKTNVGGVRERAAVLAALVLFEAEAEEEVDVVGGMTNVINGRASLSTFNAVSLADKNAGSEVDNAGVALMGCSSVTSSTSISG